MAGNDNAKRAAVALAGGPGPRPAEDGVEVAAIYAVCEVLTDHTADGEDVGVTLQYDPNNDNYGTLVGFTGMSGQRDLTSLWTPYKRGGADGEWSGLRRR